MVKGFGKLCAFARIRQIGGSADKFCERCSFQAAAKAARIRWRRWLGGETQMLPLLPAWPKPIANIGLQDASVGLSYSAWQIRYRSGKGAIMGNTIDTIHGSHYGNSAGPAPAGSDDQSARIFQTVLEDQARWTKNWTSGAPRHGYPGSCRQAIGIGHCGVGCAAVLRDVRSHALRRPALEAALPGSGTEPALTTSLSSAGATNSLFTAWFFSRRQ